HSVSLSLDGNLHVRDRLLQEGSHVGGTGRAFQIQEGQLLARLQQRNALVSRAIGVPQAQPFQLLQRRELANSKVGQPVVRKVQLAEIGCILDAKHKALVGHARLTDRQFLQVLPSANVRKSLRAEVRGVRLDHPQLVAGAELVEQLKAGAADGVGADLQDFQI